MIMKAPTHYSAFARCPATFLLIAIIVAFGLLCRYRPKVYAALFLHPYSIVKKHEYYRILTADLVHNDFTHLVLNAVSLYVFGSDLEENLLKKSLNGSFYFLLIFFSSMVTGNIAVSILNRDNFDYSSTGCSGSVMGCLFGFMIMNPYGKALRFAVIGGISNIFTGLIFILMMIFFSFWKKDSAINHQIHFFGAIGGIAATMFIAHGFLF